MLTINLFNGLVYGALLIVMCSGLALIYGLRRVVNFAHGSLYMLGAYLGYSIAMRSNFWVALVAVPAIMALGTALGTVAVTAGILVSYHFDTAASATMAGIAVGMFFCAVAGREVASRVGRRAPAPALT